MSNVTADWLSRVNMSDNCHMQQEVMQALEYHFGPVDIDHFATAATTVCQRYKSYSVEPDCKAPDALS